AASGGRRSGGGERAAGRRDARRRAGLPRSPNRPRAAAVGRRGRSRPTVDRERLGYLARRRPADALAGRVAALGCARRRLDTLSKSFLALELWHPRSSVDESA